MENEYGRRDFLKVSSAIGAGLVLGGVGLSGCGGRSGRATDNKDEFKVAAIDPVRVGVVGVGSRGSGLLQTLLSLKGVRITGVCDIVQERVARGQSWVQQAGQAKPKGYSRGERDFERMCDSEDIDLVLNATPWQWHVPISLYAMKAGKHTAVEVPAAVELEDCWALVETSEKTGRYMIMLENVCYVQEAMMILNMVRRGVLGELVHIETGYQHDIRDIRFTADGKLLWRGRRSLGRNGALYPTHAIGPAAQWACVNRGDRFDYIVSMSSSQKALNLFAAEKLGSEHPLAKLKYTQGDINCSMIRTVNGVTITMYFDCQLPRPYDRIFRVQGQKGIYIHNMEKIYIEGRSPENGGWEPIEKYIGELTHPLWKVLEENAKGKGHGGADYIMLYRLIECLRRAAAPDMDVYDAAVWSSVARLSEESVANRSRSVDFPDFTRGKWKNKTPVGIVMA